MSRNKGIEVKEASSGTNRKSKGPKRHEGGICPVFHFLPCQKNGLIDRRGRNHSNLSDRFWIQTADEDHLEAIGNENRF
jgi:hypothetical protein